MQRMRTLVQTFGFVSLLGMTVCPVHQRGSP